MAFKFKLGNGDEHEFPNAPEIIGFIGVLRKARNRKAPKDATEQQLNAHELDTEFFLIDSLLNMGQERDEDGVAIEDSEDVKALDRINPRDFGAWKTKFFGGIDPKE